MQVKQVATFVNQALAEAVGQSDLVGEDLSGIVDAGTAVFNANAVDNYVRALVDHIGRVIFVDRAYKGRAPKVVMDAWEYGSVLEKVTMETPEAEENPTWDLQDGQVYEQDKFSKPTITVKFYNTKTTFEVPISITDRQVKESFSSAQQLSGFISMIYTTIENSLTRAMDALVMRAITNFISLQYNNAGGDSEGLPEQVPPYFINLHHLYVSKTGNTLDKGFEQAMHDPDFLRFAGEEIRLTVKRMGAMSKVYNSGEKDRFTPTEDLHLILLSDFVSATSTYLQANTFHEELLKLPLFEEVPYWQGSGVDYRKNAYINVAKDSRGNLFNSYEVSMGIIGVAFDRNALGVSNWDRRTTAHRNNHAEFENLWFKNDAGFFNDENENFVVFCYSQSA